MIRSVANKGIVFLALSGFLLWPLVGLVPKGMSQARTESELVHKYTHPFCEYGRSSIDLFLLELKDSASLKGVIVIHPSLSDRFWPYREKGTILSHLRFRGFDENRIEILLGEPELKPSTALWRVPMGKPHGLRSRAWDYSVADLNEPLLVYRSIESDAIAYGNCGESGLDHQFFAEILRRNGQIVGRIVVRAASSPRFEQAKRRILKDLTGKYSIGKTRLEFAFVKDKHNDAEYWLLPSGYLEQF